MKEYSKHKKARDTWYSAPFYTTPGGYRLCIGVETRVYFGARVYVSVHIVSGEFDSYLVWPLRASITIQLLNQNSATQNHFEKKFEIDGNNKPGSSLLKEYLISCDEVESATATRQYLKNDSLKFSVTKLIVH